MEQVVSITLKLPANHVVKNMKKKLTLLIKQKSIRCLHIKRCKYEENVKDSEGIVASSAKTTTTKLQGKKQLFKQFGTTKDYFMLFLWTVMLKLKDHERYNNGHLIMDNAAIHKGSEVSNLIRVFNKLFDCDYKVCYLPAYSPQLNPIENVW